MNLPLALLGNIGLWDLILFGVVLYLIFNRSFMREAGRTAGSAAGGGGTPPPRTGSGVSLEECYRELEIPASSSTEQIREAYKQLVKVWHPDRFPGDEKLRAKANERLARINRAYETLMRARG